MPHQWFYASNGVQAGPVDAVELKRLAAARTVKPTDLVWRDGLAGWTPAAKVAGLFAAGADPAPVASLEGIGPPPAAAPNYDAPTYDGGAAPAQVLPYQGGGVPIGITARTMDLLRQTRPWVQFLSIIGFILAGLMIAAGLGIALLGMAVRGGGGFPIGMGLTYVAMSAIYFFPSLFLWRYGSRIGRLLSSGHVHELEHALEAQKAVWRLYGIIMIAGIGLFVVVIAAATLRVGM